MAERVCNMTSIVFESNRGIIFEKTSYKNGKCKLTVRRKSGGSAIITYRYRDVPGFQSPYITWDNLNCCNGWEYDESYLYTAVQQGKKLFAGITYNIFDEDGTRKQGNLAGHDKPGEADVETIIQKLQTELPDDCLLLRRDADSAFNGGKYRYIDICKKGTITDYINLEEVFAAYERLGVTMDSGIRERITGHCSESIEGLTAHFEYWNATGHMLVVTGLLLGYPIETTASLLA